MLERFGNISAGKRKKKDRTKTIWIHAASVGEVQAAVVLINELFSHAADYDYAIVVSTMTESGRTVARQQMPSSVYCFLAPIDTPCIVKRVLRKIRPDIYICLETELWPSILTELKKSGAGIVLLNGRMTERSFKRYFFIRGLMKNVLNCFSSIAVIGDIDRERFARLGVEYDRIVVTGNMKYDFPVEDAASVRNYYRSILDINEETLFICGSTRSGEEAILMRAFLDMQEQSSRNIIWLVAPRHIERIAEIRQLFSRHDVKYELFTELRKKRKREYPVILVDCMGELARLYSAGDFIFCGGSLVDIGGHNIMEAARWGRPVFYGPSMHDYADAVEILENAGAGFQVKSSDELVEKILAYTNDNEAYAEACGRAVHAASLQQGAAGRQADIVRRMLLH